MHQRQATQRRAQVLDGRGGSISVYRDESLDTLFYEMDGTSDVYNSIDQYNEWLLTKHYLSAGNIGK